MPTSELDIAEVSGQDIFRLLPNTIRTRDPGVLSSLCDAIANERNYLARLIRILVQSNNPYEAGKFEPEQWGETNEGLERALTDGSPEPAPISYHLEGLQELLLDRLSENLGNRLQGVDRETLRRCIASAVQRYKMRGSGYSLTIASQIGSVGESVSSERWSNLSGSELDRSPELYPLVGAGQLPVGSQQYNPNSFDGEPEEYRYDNPSFFPDEAGNFLENLLETNPLVTASGVLSYLNPGKYQLTGGSSSSRARISIPHLDTTIDTNATFTASFSGSWGNSVVVEVLYQNGEFSVLVSGPGTMVKYKTSKHQITHFVHLMLAAYAGIESSETGLVDLQQATGHMERTMVSEQLTPLTRTTLEPSGHAVGIVDKVTYAVSKPIRNPIIKGVSKHWMLVVTGPGSGEWVEQTDFDEDDVLTIIQQDESDGLWYEWVVSDEGELSFVKANGRDSSILVTFQDYYAWVYDGMLRITVSPPPMGPFETPTGPYDVPPDSMADWFGPDAIEPVEEWLIKDRPEDLLTNDSGLGNMSDHAGHYLAGHDLYKSTGDIRHRLVGVTGGIVEPIAPYPGDPDVIVLNGHGYYVWRDRITNNPILTKWKGDGTLENTILDVDGPIEGVNETTDSLLFGGLQLQYQSSNLLYGYGLDQTGYLVTPNNQLTNAPFGPLNQIFRPITRFEYGSYSNSGGKLAIDDEWSVGEILYVGSPYNEITTIVDHVGTTTLGWNGSPSFYSRRTAEAATPNSGEVSVRLELESLNSGFSVIVIHRSYNNSITTLGEIQVGLGVINGTFTVPNSGTIMVLHNGQATGDCFIEWIADPFDGVKTYSSDRDLLMLVSEFQIGSVHMRGNSLTLGADAGTPYYQIQNGVSALLTAAGFIPTSMTTYAADGLSFQSHADPSSPYYAASLASVNSENWDFAFIQNITSAANNLADHLTYGEAMYNQYINNNSECQVILYETPAYAFDNPSYPSVFDSPYAMRVATRDAYEELANEINSDNPNSKPVKISPVGSTIYYAGACLPTTHRQYQSLHAADDLLHLNGDGYVQAVLCHYITMTGNNPSGLLSSPEWEAIETAMTSKPVLDRTWHEEHAYRCAGLGRYPIIMLQDPDDVSVIDGDDAEFSVFADGSAPISYQWFKNGVIISGATLSTYTATSVSISDDGAQYKCVCSNSEGVVESLEATLTVSAIAPIPEILVNFTRAGFTVGSAGGKTYNDREAPVGDSLATLVGQSWALVSTANEATDIALHLDSAGTDGGANSSGPTGIGTWPNNATSTFWVGGAGPTNVHTLRLSGFSPGAQMLFEMRGWRAIDGSNRQTRVVVTDANGDQNIDYNAGANESDLASITVTADSNGEITFKPQIGAGNAVNFYYYGLLRIAPVP